MVVRILCRSAINNLLSCEPGIGKITGVECLAQRDTNRDADEVEQPPLRTIPPLRFSPSASLKASSIPHSFASPSPAALSTTVPFRLAEADLEFS
ncbi:hypothetical protein BT69DRAFT_1281331 [Atractiella rhizophila]|nr:hypothetical protein BT69DRAFT_1281331 [Atractiella rhizophila]